MRVLLLGIGMQGEAALHDLARSDSVASIVAADADVDRLRHLVASQGYEVECVKLDARDRQKLGALLSREIDVVIDLLPPALVPEVARAAVEHRVHLVNTCYSRPELLALDRAARDAGVAILPECGLDPGIDLVLLAEAVRSLDVVEELRCYGAGLPAPEAIDNPLAYKVTWNFDGVLEAYRNEARVIRGGRLVTIGAKELFAEEHTHVISIEGLGRLEAFANSDVVPFIEQLGIERSALAHAGRFTLRYPGHCALWKALVDLGFLDRAPVDVDGQSVDRKGYLASLVEPQIRLADNESDVALVRIEAIGRQGSERVCAVFQVLERRHPETGLTGMSRCVGSTASAGAQMIVDGTIDARGVLAPTRDVPFERFAQELRRRGIDVATALTAPAPRE